MKVTDNDGGMDTASERIPSRAEVEQVNARARNPEMEGEIPRTRAPFGVGRLRLGVTKILMKIREEWYQENQEFYQARTRAIETQIKTGKIDGALRPETYHPKGGRISINTKLE